MMLLSPIYPNVEKFALYLTHNRDDAKDILGETMLIAYEQFEKLRDEKAFLSFLLTIVSRLHKQRLRYAKRFDSSDNIEELFDQGVSPENKADVGFLYSALEQLPERQREAVILAEIMGFQHKEIQKIQGGTLTGVKVRIFRAKKKLARLLGVDSNVGGEVS